MAMNQVASKGLMNIGRKSVTTYIEKDFFGVYHITTKDIAGSFSGTRPERIELARKYKPLTYSQNKLENEPVETDVTFGQMRFDIDNKPKTHGQFEPSNDRRLFDTIDIKQSFVPIEKDESKAILTETEVEIQPEGVFQPQHEGENPPIKIVDVEPITSLAEVLKLFKNDNPVINELGKYDNKPPLTFYFSSSSNLVGEQTKEETNPDMVSKLSGHRLDEKELKKTIEEAQHIADRKSKPPLVHDPTKEVYDVDDLAASETLESSVQFDDELDEKYDVKKEKQNRSTNALDYLKKIRSQQLEPTAKGLKHRINTENPYPLSPSIKLDSQGFKIYTDQVPNWEKCRHVEILSYIKRAIIYNNYDILAVNKPYGIPSHGGKGEKFDMNNLVQEVASEMKIEKVYLAHRIDKTTTGVLLFATSEERAHHLNKLFRSDQIKKVYWCITRGIPDPEEGIIDIPIGEFTLAGKVRRCLAPENIDSKRQLSKRYREAKRAITEYHVIDKADQCALVEVKPRSGVTHQIRCHLGFALNRPILGDHKYSMIGKIAPQTLPVPMLNALHMRQSKVRTLPLHLHAKSIMIPGAKANGETLFINAPLPQHFRANAKSLKLMKDDLLRAEARK